MVKFRIKEEWIANRELENFLTSKESLENYLDEYEDEITKNVNEVYRKKKFRFKLGDIYSTILTFMIDKWKSRNVVTGLKVDIKDESIDKASDILMELLNPEE